VTVARPLENEKLKGVKNIAPLWFGGSGFAIVKEPETLIVISKEVPPKTEKLLPE
jgi:hypothetical protein